MSAGEGQKRAGRRARGVAAAAVLVVAIAFVASSAWQILAAVFYARPPHVRPPTPAEAECVVRLRSLEAALERGTDRATHATMAKAPPEPGAADPATLAAQAAERAATEAEAHDAFEAALAPEWDDADSAKRACATTPRAREAWAALLRLRRGLEGGARKQAHEIAPLRRDFETRLP
jgi:hypothetical protein